MDRNFHIAKVLFDEAVEYFGSVFHTTLSNIDFTYRFSSKCAKAIMGIGELCSRDDVGEENAGFKDNSSYERNYGIGFFKETGAKSDIRTAVENRLDECRNIFRAMLSIRIECDNYVGIFRFTKKLDPSPERRALAAIYEERKDFCSRGACLFGGIVSTPVVYDEYVAV